MCGCKETFKSCFRLLPVKIYYTLATHQDHMNKNNAQSIRLIPSSYGTEAIAIEKIAVLSVRVGKEIFNSCFRLLPVKIYYTLATHQDQINKKYHTI